MFKRLIFKLLQHQDIHLKLDVKSYVFDIRFRELSFIGYKFALNYKLGPFITIHYPDKSSNGSYTGLRELNKALVSILREYSYVDLNIKINKPYFFLFYESGYKISALHSYEIVKKSDRDTLIDICTVKGRNTLKKAMSFKFNHNSRFFESTDIADVIKISDLTWERQGKERPWCKIDLDNLLEIYSPNCFRYTYIKNHNNEIVAFALIYLDSKHSTSWYLVGGAIPAERKNGIQSLCLWYAINDSLSRTKIFDFEGSNNLKISSNFESLGGSIYTVYRVNKSNLLLDKIVSILR